MAAATPAELEMLDRFLRCCFDRGPDFKATAAEIFTAFEDWRRDNNVFPVSQRRLSVILRCAGIPRLRSNGSWYLGLKHYSGDLTPEWDRALAEYRGR